MSAAPAASESTLLLRTMVARLESLDTTMKALLQLSQQRRTATPAPAAAPLSGPEVASDRDLDGKFGDLEIKTKDPRDWAGPTMRGRRMSECPPEYLDLLADRLDYFSRKAHENNEQTNNGKDKAPFLRSDAARARGWAARIRSGKHKPAPVAGTASDWADDTMANAQAWSDQQKDTEPEPWSSDVGF